MQINEIKDKTMAISVNNSVKPGNIRFVKVEYDGNIKDCPHIDRLWNNDFSAELNQVDFDDFMEFYEKNKYK